jgi:diguanylate cyclase (GGDEF)-like protein/PAS domain S-box-containing protein
MATEPATSERKSISAAGGGGPPAAEQKARHPLPLWLRAAARVRLWLWRAGLGRSGLARKGGDSESSERYFQSLIENALDTITLIGADGTIHYESPSVERVLGYRPEDLLGRNVFEYVHPDDRPIVLREFEQLLRDPGSMQSVELRFLHAAGHWVTMEVIGRNLLKDPAVQGVVVNARDITARKAAEAQLLYDAFHDKLTGLPNRALFMDRLAQAIGRGRRHGHPSFAVIFLDVDRFKVVNDSLGHPAGDRLLVDLAHRLEEAIRPGDTVARLGGDEFTVLLDGVSDVHEAALIADRVHQTLKTPFEIDDRELHVDASIGIALADADA